MPLDTKQQKWLPLGLNPPDIATGIPLPELGKVYSAQQQFPYFLPPFQALQSCGKQVSCLNSAAAPEGSLKSSRKRFLVFDQSGNQTRILQCGFPLQFPSIAAEQGRILDSLNPEKRFSKDLGDPVHEVHVEKSYNGEEESEMHEDTEEINALLYSDDEDSDDYESDDEVMSTGHSPFPVEQQACNKKVTEELDEVESTSDYDGPRRKRQKLLDHTYRDPSLSLVGTKLEGCLPDEKLLESKEETGSGLSDEQSRKDKIHIAMRILESVVPGAKGKEALLLLDEAIDYLKSLKRNLNSSNGLNNNRW